MQKNRQNYFFTSKRVLQLQRIQICTKFKINFCQEMSTFFQDILKIFWGSGKNFEDDDPQDKVPDTWANLPLVDSKGSDEKEDQVENSVDSSPFENYKWHILGVTIVAAILYPFLAGKVEIRYVPESERGLKNVGSPGSAFSTSTTPSPQEMGEVASPANWIDDENLADNLKQFLKTLQKKYSTQTRESWIKIYAAISSTMTPQKPVQPAAIVFLSHPSAKKEGKNFATCLAHEIGSHTNSLFKNKSPSTSSGGRGKGSKVLKISKNILNRFPTLDQMYRTIDDYLFRDMGKVIVVENVDEINSEDHLFPFHAYCDNSEAPEKRATFIFTIQTEPDILKKFDWVEENAAAISQSILQASWTSLSGDKRPAIIARVSATVVLLEPGDECNFSF